MPILDFLKEVLPANARQSLRFIKKIPKPDGKHDEVVHNKFYDAVDDNTIEDIEDYVSNGWNVYYATAGFGATSKATADNAVCKKELYVDIDCGIGKPYADKIAGLIALRTFANDLGLPKPTVVDSGNGIHAHWYFKESVPVHEWKAVAEALKAKCAEKSFSADPTCTADIVRVLRVPGTINTRGGETVKQISPIVYYSFEKLRDIIGESQVGMFAKARQLTQANKGSGKTETSKLLNSNRVTKFEVILNKSISGAGCAQIKHAYENQHDLSEPLWRGILSEAQVCEDREWAIHTVSDKHPNYTPEETEKKAGETRGPYTCETYQKLDMGSLCDGCQFRDKITAPVQIGSEIKRATENKVEVGKDIYEIPSYPDPYFRGKNGGIYHYAIVNEETKERKEECLYPHDLYAYKRMRDPAIGDMIWFRHHLPNQDVREFCLPQSEYSSRDKFREGMNREGVVVFNLVDLDKLQRFLGTQIKELQFKEKAEAMKTRFGWTLDDTFIVGNREYSKDGVRIIPMARQLDDFVRWFTPKGDLEQWKKIAKSYSTEPFDLHALGLLAGFGSTLMHLSPENGGMINFFSKKSGTGKTTILMASNSIWGDPKALMKNAADTKLSKVHRMGVLNGLPMSMDEMTNTSPEELSDLIYQGTQGKGRDRMMASVNSERTNNTTWKQITICSSNASMEDRLGTIKNDPQGEMARVLEIQLTAPVPSSVLESQKLFNSMQDNYGHAGDLFMRYVIPNLDNVRALWNNTRDSIYTKHSWTQTERYKLNNVICIITAGFITNRLGLTNYDMARLTSTALGLVKDAAERLIASASKAVETFAMFLNKNVNNLLIIKDEQRVKGVPEVPAKEPKGSLMARYETDTGSLFISQRDFNKWCSDLYINAREVKGQFKDETGKELHVIKKRMGKGWNADFGPVVAYEIIDAVNVLGLEGLNIIEGSSELAPATVS
jgi:hypothetical protein